VYCNTLVGSFCHVTSTENELSICRVVRCTLYVAQVDLRVEFTGFHLHVFYGEFSVHLRGENFGGFCISKPCFPCTFGTISVFVL
jgi:hypothetical protein